MAARANILRCLNRCLQRWTVEWTNNISPNGCFGRNKDDRKYSNSFFFCFVLFFCFTYDHRIFSSLIKVRRHGIVCINRDIVVGLCSELRLRSPYYTHLAYGNSKTVSPRGNRTQDFSILIQCLYPLWSITKLDSLSLFKVSSNEYASN